MEPMTYYRAPRVRLKIAVATLLFASVLAFAAAPVAAETGLCYHRHSTTGRWVCEIEVEDGPTNEPRKGTTVKDGVRYFCIERGPHEVQHGHWSCYPLGPAFDANALGQHCVRPGHFDISPCEINDIIELPDGRWIGVFHLGGTKFWCSHGSVEVYDWHCEPLTPEVGDIDVFTEGTGYDLNITWSSSPPCVPLGCPLAGYEVTYSHPGGGTTRKGLTFVLPSDPREVTYQVDGGDWYTPHIAASYGSNTYVIMHFGSNTWETCGHPALVG